jgi:hypothetical protein
MKTWIRLLAVSLVAAMGVGVAVAWAADSADKAAAPKAPDVKTADTKAVEPAPKATETKATETKAPEAAPKATETKATETKAPEAAPKATETKATETKAATTATSTAKMIELDIKLPKAQFEGTPKNLPAAPTLEKYVDKARPPFMVPEGTKNLAMGTPVKSSDMEPIIGELKLVNDGDAETGDGHYVELGPNRQWVQIDLKEKASIYAFLVWHYHSEGRVYHDVVVQVSDDPDFIKDVKTVYNNDFDNSSGMGIGKDLEYVEDFRGRLIDAKGVQGRYVRLYSNGNTSNDQNHYIEVMVFGIPAK